MQISYDSKTDLLYIRHEHGLQEITNKRVTDDVVFDIGENNKIVGIEIMEASKNVNLEKLMPMEFEKII